MLSYRLLKHDVASAILAVPGRAKLLSWQSCGFWWEGCESQQVCLPWPSLLLSAFKWKTTSITLWAAARHAVSCCATQGYVIPALFAVSPCASTTACRQWACTQGMLNHAEHFIRLQTHLMRRMRPHCCCYCYSHHCCCCCWGSTLTHWKKSLTSLTNAHRWS